jgi:hypothetical protein
VHSRTIRNGLRRGDETRVTRQDKFTKNQYKKQSVNSTRKSGNPQVFFTEMYQGWGLGPLEALSLVLIRSKNGGKKMNNFVPGRKSL